MIEFNHTLFRFDMEIKKILCSTVFSIKYTF